MNFFKRIFNRKKKRKKEIPRRYLKDVKAGDVITIEWNRIHGGIGNVKCLNNDPATKKILLQVTWNNYKAIKCDEKETFILDYKCKELANFNLLNQSVKLPKVDDDHQDDDDFDDDNENLLDLQKQMNDAIALEDYKKAELFKKKIAKYLKKRND